MIHKDLKPTLLILFLCWVGACCTRLSLNEQFSFASFILAVSFWSLAFGCLLYRLSSLPSFPMGAMVLVAIAGRLLFFNSNPVLSTDVYRYLWDGYVLQQGFNPLSVTPEMWCSWANEILPFFPKDHGSMPSIYPPLALLYFCVVQWCAQSPVAFQIAATLCDVLTLSALAKTLKERGQSSNHLTWFALHPVAMLSSAYGAHVDALGLMFLSGFIYTFSKRSKAAPIFLAAAALVKLWPITLVIMFGWSRQAWKSWALSLALFLLPLILWFGPESAYLGLLRYLGQWSFFNPIYAQLAVMLGHPAARMLSLTLWLSGLSILLCYTKAEKDWPSLGLAVVGLYLLSSPTVYPWYTLWLMPFLVVSGNIAWLLFSLLTLCSYEVVEGYLREGVWQEQAWPGILAYATLLGVCLIKASHKLNKHWAAKHKEIKPSKTSPHQCSAR